MNDRHLHRVDALRRAVLESLGTLDRATRTAAAEGTLTGELGALIAKIHADASAITDDDVTALTRAGHSDDALFEVIAAAAFGAGAARLAAAKRAMGGR